LDEAAAELRRRLGPDVTDAATKILTTGVSGQQLALPLARLMSVPLVACRREAAGAGAVANAMGRGAYADALDVTYRSKLCGNQPVS
jgi:adenine/guanine phosphoribosyltransferase-like PRPP-binding protein